MRIKKYMQFIKEADESEEDLDAIEGEDIDDNEYVSNDSPESYVISKLNNIKSKIDNMFDSDDEIKSTEVEDDSREIQKKVNSEDIEGISFKDLGMSLESSELSKNTKTHKNLTIKFSDVQFYYTLLFKIDLKQVVSEEEMSTDKIKKCYIKFKKYKVDGFDLVGEISKMIDISEIDEDFLVGLKIELDDETGDGGEELTIEYEE